MTGQMQQRSCLIARIDWYELRRGLFEKGNVMMRQKRLYFIFVVIVTTLVFLNIVSLINNNRYDERYGLITKRVRFVHMLKPQLENLENQLWGIISVYDPHQGRKVKLSELRQEEIIGDMTRSIDAAAALTNHKELLLQLEILKRSVRSLSRRIDVITERVEMKAMDEVSTELIFPDAKHVYMLSESYVDELEKLLEQFRLVKNVIEDNVGKYDEIEIRDLASQYTEVVKNHNKWLLVNVICAIGLVILIIVFLIGTFRI